MLVSFGLAGCTTHAPSHPVHLPTPVTTNDLTWVNFHFILVNATNTSPNLRSETSLLQDSIISGLRETGLFRNVDQANTNAAANGIKILASIHQITKVSAHSRVWFGGLAGKARAVVRVTVSDLTTGNPVDVFVVEGQTGASAWAGLTDEAVLRAAQQVVAEIARLDSQAAQQLIDHGK